MTTVYVARNGGGAIIGIARNPGCTGLDEAIDDSDAAVQAYLNPSAAAILAVLRAGAKSVYDDTSPAGRVARAIVLAIVTEFNTLRGDFVSLSALQAAIAAAPNTLAGMKAAIAGLTPLSARTAAQVRTAIRNDIDADA